MAKAKPTNWFDRKYDRAMERATAERALSMIAKDAKAIRAVKRALVEHDKNDEDSRWMGPTRTQAIRDALVEVLQEQG